MKRAGLLFLVATVLFASCNDMGDVVEYLDILSLHPAPNSTNVDKAAIVTVQFDRPVHIAEVEKIRLRYLDDPSEIQNIVGCGLMPMITETHCVGPIIWKPGKTVEVIIPKDLRDPDGRQLRDPVIYSFSIAPDTIPFQLAYSQPQDGDTISIGTTGSLLGGLKFTDYLPLHLHLTNLSIDPPASIQPIFVGVNGRNLPTKMFHILVSDLQPHITYTLTVSQEITDYEGESLPHDYHIAFHTLP